MRTTVLPSMLEILTRNYNFRNKSAQLYELGRTYLRRSDGLADEPRILSLGAYGPDMDFFRMKGVVESIAAALRIQNVSFHACRDNPSYHPGRCAKMYAGDLELGVFGQVHPNVAMNYGVDTELYCAELRFDALFSVRGETPVYTPLPKFPATTRDIALVCDQEIPAADLSDCIKTSGGQYLENCQLFDVYTGSHIPAGKKSVAFSLTLRAKDQTLTDVHADETVAAVLAALKEKYNAVIR